MPPAAALWQLFLRRWAYPTAAVMCLCVVGLMAAGAGLEDWYKDEGSGQLFNMTISRKGDRFRYELKEGLFSATFTWSQASGEDLTAPFQNLIDGSCSYTESECPTVPLGTFSLLH